MNLKQRFSITFSLLFSVVLGTCLILIFIFFSRYRKEEFSARLAEKAQTASRLLIYVDEIDNQMLKIIDKNTINRLYNEKILVFDEKLNLIYSSADDTVPPDWSRNALLYLESHGKMYRKYKELDIYGEYFHSGERGYYTVVTAEDRYGNNKLNYLKVLLFTAFGTGTVLIWFLSFYASKIGLKPLDRFSERIKDITEQNLNTRVVPTHTNNEIGALSVAFNQMMDRIDQAYSKQKEFTGNASHELRTPISRITAQLENLLQAEELDEKTRSVLKSISNETYQLSDVVTSLLVLANMNIEPDFRSFPSVRLDEIIFNAASRLNKQYPDLKLVFEIASDTENMPSLDIKGDELLLNIAIGNLLKNAYLYSDNKVVNCVIRITETHLFLVITNTGETPKVAYLSELFNAFLRGSNSAHTPGSGLGLSIVKRIINYHQGEIQYFIPQENMNEINIRFPKQEPIP